MLGLSSEKHSSSDFWQLHESRYRLKRNNVNYKYLPSRLEDGL